MAVLSTDGYASLLHLGANIIADAAVGPKSVDWAISGALWKRGRAPDDPKGCRPLHGRGARQRTAHPSKEEVMLVLSRKTDDSIVIGSEIEVTVLAVNNNRVKLGIRAPGHVRVVRSELLTRADGQVTVPTSEVFAATAEHEPPVSALPR
jgi:carbon storage regulator